MSQESEVQAPSSMASTGLYHSLRGSDQPVAFETAANTNGSAGQISRSSVTSTMVPGPDIGRNPMDDIGFGFFSNVTSSTERPIAKFNLSDELTVTFLVLELIFAAFIVIGNSLILFYIFRRTDLRKPSYMYLASIAFSHLLVGLIVIPLYILGHFPENFMNNAVCKIAKFMASLASTASPYSAVILAVHHVRERHRKGQMQIKRWHVAIDLSLVWVLSVGYGVKDIFLYEMVLETYSHGDDHIELVYMCEIPDKRQIISDIFVLVDFVLLYCIPAGMLCMLYVRLLQQVKAAHRRMLRQAQEITGTGTGTGNGTDASDANPFQDPKTKNMICTLTILVTAFCLCFFGVHIWEIYVYWGPGHFKDSWVILNILELASFSQGWMNVVLIFIFNDAFRRSLTRWSLLRRRSTSSWNPQNRGSVETTASIILSIALPQSQAEHIVSANRRRGTEQSIFTTRGSQAVPLVSATRGSQAVPPVSAIRGSQAEQTRTTNGFQRTDTDMISRTTSV